MRAVDALRRPEYTGENRCWPCTVVNAVVVVGLAVVVGFLSPPLGLATLAVGAALVALRGYVVPYTPTFAPRLAARLPVEFGHGPGRTDGGETPEPGTSESLSTEESLDGETLVRELAAAGVVTADDAGELFLASDARRTWEAGIRRLRDATDDELAAAAADAAPFEASGRVEGDGEWVVVTSDDGEKEAWLRRPHAVAETAAVALLTGDPYGLDRTTAAQAATPLRLFLEDCPACEGEVVETTVSSCCGGTMGLYDNPDTPVLACESCDEVLYEL